MQLVFKATRAVIQFIRLSSSSRWLLFYSFFLLTAIRLGLRFLPFKTLQQKVDRLSQSMTKTPSYTLYGIVWAVEWSTRMMPGGAKCLARALTTQILMGQQRYPYDLCIGVLKSEAGDLKAHAWIESDDQIVVGWLPEIANYKRLEKSFYQGMAGLT